MPWGSQLPFWLLLHLPSLVCETRTVLRPFLSSLGGGARASGTIPISAAHPQLLSPALTLSA